MQARRRKFNPVNKIVVKSEGKSNGNLLSNEKPKRDKKDKLKKRKRLIIRNLSFQVTKEELQEAFSKYGNVLEVNIPLNADGRKRGFAFVEYQDTKSLIGAMKALNNKEIHGRRVAIDFAIDKTSYQLKVQGLKKEEVTSPNKDVKEEILSESSDESDEEKPDISIIETDSKNIDENEKRVNDFLEEFESGFETIQNNDESDESSDNESDGTEEESEEEDSEEMSDVEENKKSNKLKTDDVKSSKELKNKKSSDVSEGRTVFLRNVSFSTSKESLKEALEKYGECEYCVICVDPFTDHSKGTAFVKFKDKECADKLIQESWGEPGILVDGRKLMCSSALRREDILEQNNQEKKPKDKRNLNLLKVGLIMPNSAESEGVSPSDMAKRTQLEMITKRKLRNVNFFVSDKRLMVHNIPKTLTDVQLRKLFKQAAGKGAAITEARVMKEFKKTNAEGIPLSKGFGFVSFSRPEDALKALTELNNNPNTFSHQKRPIVGFSVENKVALLSKDRRKERLQQRNKKRTEEKQERQLAENKKKRNKEPCEENPPSKKNKKRKINTNDEESIQQQHQKATPGKKTKQQKKNRKPKKKRNPKNLVQSRQNFSSMVNQFKEKLLNKM